MSIYKKFGNTVEESEGIWVDVPSMEPVEHEELDGWLADATTSGIKLARAGMTNRRFMIEVAKSAKEETQRSKRKEKDPAKLTSEELADKVISEAKKAREQFARACVLDWRGPAFVDSTGQPLPFSTQAAVQVCVDLPEFFEALHKIANRAQTFRATELEEQEKN